MRVVLLAVTISGPAQSACFGLAFVR